MLFETLLVTSQTIPDSCYVEFRNHQRVSGIIKNEEWIISPDKLKFKAEGETRFNAYGPEEIMSFQIGNEYYIGAEVDVDYASLNAEDITEDSTITLHREFHFLKRIGEGKVSLYALLLQNKRYNFYVGKDSITLLQCKRFIANPSMIYDKYFLVNGENYYERAIYRQQLETLLPENAGLHRRINSTEYSLYSMIALWKAYFQLNNSGWTKNKYPKRITFGVYTANS